MTNEWIKKAETLLEALPYMRAFQGQTVVIKYGGAAQLEPELKAALSSGSNCAAPPYLITMVWPWKRRMYGSASSRVSAFLMYSSVIMKSLR